MIPGGSDVGTWRWHSKKVERHGFDWYSMMMTMTLMMTTTLLLLLLSMIKIIPLIIMNVLLLLIIILLHCQNLLERRENLKKITPKWRKMKTIPLNKNIDMSPEIPWIGTVLKGNVIFQPVWPVEALRSEGMYRMNPGTGPRERRAPPRLGCPRGVLQGKMRRLEAWQMVEWNNYSLENERMSPENQWLEDVFPTKIVPF